jgi:tetratricopeptide (TPR) repeat protein
MGAIVPRLRWGGPVFRYEVLFARGACLAEKKEFDAAIADFTQAIQENPNYGEAYLNRAKIFYENGEYDRSWNDLCQANKLGVHADEEFEKDLKSKMAPMFSKMLKREAAKECCQEAANYSNRKDYKNAIISYNKAIEVDPDFSKAYCDRGLSYIQIGNLSQALSDFNKAIDLDPNDCLSYSNRGIIYRNQGSFDKAILDYSKAIKIKPDFPEAYFNRGYAYFMQVKLDEAILDYSEAIKLKPDFIQAYLNRAIAYSMKTSFVEAKADMEKVKSLGGKIPKELENYAQEFKKIMGNRGE